MNPKSTNFFKEGKFVVESNKNLYTIILIYYYKTPYTYIYKTIKIYIFIYYYKFIY